MSSKSGDELIRRAAIGERVRAVREALGTTGEQFAAAMTKQARAYGLKKRYDKTRLSRIETGSGLLKAEESAIVGVLDPEQRGAIWLVLGGATPMPAQAGFRKVR